jgi:hypothetical protein
MSGSGGSDGGSATGSTGAGGAATCQGAGTSDLSDVSIVFPPQRCTFSLAEAAAGVTIDYAVVVTSGGYFVVPKAQDAGQCDTPGPSGLTTFASLSGGGQSYCLCDVGLCMPPSNMDAVLKNGSYPASFKWDGKNWGGPSDTNNPKGPPFPPGHYTLTVSAKGAILTPGPAVPFVVTGTFPIELTP